MTRRCAGCFDAGGARAPEAACRAITPNLATGRELSVVWGVHCVVAEDAKDQDDMVDRAGSIAFRDGFAKAGQRVIIVAGVPGNNLFALVFASSAAAGHPVQAATSLRMPIFSRRAFSASGSAADHSASFPCNGRTRPNSTIWFGGSSDR
jgi:hypothetical protein